MFDLFDCGDLKYFGLGIIKFMHILLNVIK